ncbi:pilus assembly protein PilP [Pseudothauera nasutitermitis]|uniref:Pilus assembly protein PilP n=1 Tax=Pseudothauera nasutitermitis TaxID=2565930 RepID=A0A4S4AWI5_9RHOO|nr:pilus assembly protein PilP [Pseudothauera nasutitermitis]THF62968.1 pilus assembly protein PilP [Pseudothauera nasutitermitis]
MRGRIRFAPLCVLLAAALLAGCASEEENIQAWMAEQTKGMRGSVKPLPEIRPFPVVEYDAEALPTPFSTARLVPETRQSGGGALRPDLDRRREPLEAYPLESLTMVGVLMRGKDADALIRVDNTIHQIRVGNHMGQNFGVVTEVTETEVILRELVEDVNGDWSERISSLLLQEQQEARK